MNSALMGIGIGTIVGLVTMARRSRRQHAVSSFGLSAGLPVDAEVVEHVGPRFVRGAVVGLLGMLVGGIGIGTVMAVRGMTGDDSLMLAVWVLAAALIGRAVGVAVLGLVSAAVPVAGPRVARSRVVGIRDLISDGEIALAVVATVLPLLALIAGPSDGSVAWPALLTVGTLVVAAVAATRIVRRPQPAGSARHLAWDDALRARTLRDVVAGVTLVGSSYGLLSVSVFAVLPPGPVATGTAWLFVVLAVLGFVVSILPGPGSRFRRRLWPDGIEPAEEANASEVAS